MSTVSREVSDETVQNGSFLILIILSFVNIGMVIVILISSVSVIHPGPELGRAGETEDEVRAVWEGAVEVGREGRVILLLEEVECVARVFGGSGHGRRVTAQLQSLLDLRQSTVVMVATTMSPERLGTKLALRQPGTGHWAGRRGRCLEGTPGS